MFSLGRIHVVVLGLVAALLVPAGRLYTVNARFGIAPSLDNRYDVVRVGR